MVLHSSASWSISFKLCLVPIARSYDWPTGHLIVLHYITERLATEHELLRLKEEAEQANETKSHFLAQMNHELRILLSAIMGYAERRKLWFDCAGLQSAPQTCRRIARI